MKTLQCLRNLDWRCNLLIFNKGAVDYGGFYGECDYGECEYGGCDYGEYEYGGCVSVRVWPMG